jgi:hypothetical protein
MLSYADRTVAVTSRPATATFRTTMADELVCLTRRPIACVISDVSSRAQIRSYEVASKRRKRASSKSKDLNAEKF